VAIPLTPRGTWNLDALTALLPEPLLSYNLDFSLINSQDLICINMAVQPKDLQDFIKQVILYFLCVLKARKSTIFSPVF
jgi:hypothetical protein